MAGLNEPLVNNTSLSTQPDSLQAESGELSADLDIDSLGFLAETAINPEIQILKERENSENSPDINDFALPEARNLDISAGGFTPNFSQGVNSQQPEIISIFDFAPAFLDEQETSAGKMLRVQINSVDFKSRNILEFIEKLKGNNQTKELIEELEAKYNEELTNINNDIGFLRNILFNLTKAKDAFVVKGNERKIVSQISAIRGVNSISNIKSPKDILIENLGFTEEGYTNFLNSKILIQLIQDLTISALEYSPTLFGFADNRKVDNDPINIIQNNNLTAGKFQFRVSSLREGLKRDLNDWLTNENLSSKLPSNSSDKITLLSLISAKEFSVSGGLTATSNILERFDNAPQNRHAFLAVFGSIGNNVLSGIGGTNSLVSNFIVKDAEENVVLPFEKKFIEQDEKFYIPGSAFYVDNIIKNRENILDTGKLDNFSRRFDSILSDVKNFINKTLTLDGVEDQTVKQTLTPRNFFRSILSSIEWVVRSNTVWSGDQGKYQPLNPFKWELATIGLALISDDVKQLFFNFVISNGFARHKISSNGFYSSLEETEITEETIGTLISGQGVPPSIENIRDETLKELIRLIADRKQFAIADETIVLNYFLRGGENSLGLTLEGGINNALNIFDESTKTLSTANISSSENQAKYFNEEGRTKFNSVSGINLMWMVYELYLETMNYLFSAAFGSTAIGGFISVNEEEFNASYGVLKFLQDGDTGFVERNELFNEKLSFLQSILGNLESQTNLIRNILDVFRATNKRIKTANQEIQSLFVENEEIVEKIENLRNEEGGQDALSSLSSPQISISQAMLDDFISSREDLETPFLDQTKLTKNQKTFIFKKLKEERFKIKKGFNAKILSIGLPAGFLDSLNARFDRFVVGKNLSVFEEQEKKEIDVIKINVFKQDLEFEDIIFKPKPFIFEMSRFLTRNSFNIEELETQNIETRNYNFDGSHPRNENLFDIRSRTEYDFLNQNQKRDLFNNHVEDYLLNLYMRTLTGAKLSEKEFYLNNGIFDNLVDNALIDKIKQIITNYISSSSGRRINFEDLKKQNKNLKNILERIEQNKITSSVLNQLKAEFSGTSETKSIELSEDLKDFIRIFSHRSILFGAGAMRKKITSPKLFERVFNILIDQDDFIIDLNKTLSTQSGKELWELANQQGKIDSFKDENDNVFHKLKQRNFKDNNSDFLRFFITIEQLPEIIREEDVQPPITGDGTTFTDQVDDRVSTENGEAGRDRPADFEQQFI